jgi:integrase
MAHLIRPWQVRYIDKAGRRCASATPGARKVRQRARKWYGCNVPGHPPEKRIPLCANKDAARQMLAELVRKGERGEAGLEDQTTRARDVPLTAHLETFKQRLQYKRVGAHRVAVLSQRLTDTFDACGWKYPQDMDANAALGYLSDRRRLPRCEGGLSAASFNYYLKALSQFGRWMASDKERRLTHNPFADCPLANVRVDRRHDRRDLSPEELARLFEATLARKRSFRGLGPVDRHTLYLTAAATGFRSSELFSLTPESFDLDADPPTVTLAAKIAKNKKPVVQPLPAAVAGHLREYLAGRPPGVAVWLGLGTWVEKAAMMLRHDLKAAGIPYVVQGPDGPLYADFHALRHSFVTMLERSGATPKTAQELARHSDIRLTLQRYTHANVATLASAVERLPLPGSEQRLAPQEMVVAALLVTQTVLGFLLGLPDLGCTLVAPPVAPPSGTDGDGTGLARTEEQGMAAAG